MPIFSLLITSLSPPFFSPLSRLYFFFPLPFFLLLYLASFFYITAFLSNYTFTTQPFSFWIMHSLSTPLLHFSFSLFLFPSLPFSHLLSFFLSLPSLQPLSLSNQSYSLSFSPLFFIHYPPSLSLLFALVFLSLFLTSLSSLFSFFSLPITPLVIIW